MRYSQLSLRQRATVLEDPRNYPLRVSFLGKTGLLGFEGVALLIRHGVDFEIDNGQMRRILGGSEEEEEEPGPADSGEEVPYTMPYSTAQPPPSSRRTTDLWVGFLTMTSLVALLVFAILRIVSRLSRRGPAERTERHRPEAKKTKGDGRRKQSIVQRVRKRTPQILFALSVAREIGERMSAMERR